MLVLSRKKKQRIIIDLGYEQLSCQVIEVRGDKVRLGIDAPKRIGVHREEIWLQIQARRVEEQEHREQQQQAAAEPAPAVVP